MTAVEANFDGLVGPTHNYGGHSAGNVASQANAGSVSDPRAAVLEGIDKAARLAARGLVQGVLPPHDRPDMAFLRSLGFSGSDAAVLEGAWRAEPRLVRQAAAASAMWTANAATVSPSADCADGRAHFTPANLNTMLHRSLEADQTTRALRAAFPDSRRFAVHDPLPAHPAFADEGAANHMRLAAEHGAEGVEVFVAGRGAFDPEGDPPARHTDAVGVAIARRHGLRPARVAHLRQSRAAIDAGAFHNDVVAVSAETTVFFHAQAFADKTAALDAVRRAADGLFEPAFVEIPAEAVPLGDAVASYLFNSQLLRAPDADRLVLAAPREAEANPAARAACEALVAGNGPIGAVEFVDVRQSMRNGGGPACLRLRVVLTPAERAAAHQPLFLDPQAADVLRDWARRRYRDRLAPNDLGDPALLRESREALDELTQILELGGDFYPFQR